MDQVEPENVNDDNKEPMTQEEKISLFRKIRRAAESYNCYKLQQSDSSTESLFTFPKYCKIFFGLDPKVITKLLKKGEIELYD